MTMQEAMEQGRYIRPTGWTGCYFFPSTNNQWVFVTGPHCNGAGKMDMVQIDSWEVLTYQEMERTHYREERKFPQFKLRYKLSTGKWVDHLKYGQTGFTYWCFYS